MLLGTEVGIGPGDSVLDGDAAPPQKVPNFTAHVCCGQTAGWIGLGPGDIVLDGDQLPPRGKRYSSPHFSAHV